MDQNKTALLKKISPHCEHRSKRIGGSVKPVFGSLTGLSKVNLEFRNPGLKTLILGC